MEINAQSAPFVVRGKCESYSCNPFIRKRWRIHFVRSTRVDHIFFLNLSLFVIYILVQLARKFTLQHHFFQNSEKIDSFNGQAPKLVCATRSWACSQEILGPPMTSVAGRARARLCGRFAVKVPILKLTLIVLRAEFVYLRPFHFFSTNFQYC